MVEKGEGAEPKDDGVEDDLDIGRGEEELEGRRGEEEDLKDESTTCGELEVGAEVGDEEGIERG